MSITRVGILDYSVGNMGSLINALRRLGVEPLILRDIKFIRQVDSLILPGVGSFDSAMELLRPVSVELSSMRGSVPMLGICLGLQVMFMGSDEGRSPGLSWYPGRVVRIRGPRVPHISWDPVEVVKPCTLLDHGDYYYFMHSYSVMNPGDDIPYSAVTNYGGDRILSVLCDEDRSVYGTQFHPEKSSKAGLKLLSNFLNIARR